MPVCKTGGIKLWGQMPRGAEPPLLTKETLITEEKLEQLERWVNDKYRESTASDWENAAELLAAYRRLQREADMYFRLMQTRTPD